MEQAGLYLRVSSPGQEDGYSLPDQERDCMAHREKMGYQVRPEYVWNDGAQKSWTLNRPGLRAAMDAIRKGEIKILIVGRYDRFSRIQMQQAIAVYEIEQLYGGRVESADPREQFGRDSTGVLLRSVNAWRAEQELELIRERTQGGRRSRAQSGKLIASPFPLYGYAWADAQERRGKTRYVVDPETARIVERIFREIAAGVKLKHIALYLTDEKVPTPAQVLAARGLISPDRFDITGDWSKTMVNRIAKNPAYCGRYVAYRTVTTAGQQPDEDGHLQVYVRTRTRPEDDPARVVLPPDICPAIVSEELFEEVQRQLKHNQQESTRNSNDPHAYLLRGGFAICGYCGGVMTTSTCGPVGKKIHQYRCGKAVAATINRCAGRSFCVSVPVLDRAVWTAVQYLFSDPKRIRAILETQLDHQADDNQREADRRKAAVDQLQEIGRQLENATRAVLNAPDEQTHALWSQQVTNLVAQRTGALKELDDLDQAQRRREAAVAYLQSVEQWCAALGPEIEQATYEEKRYLLRGLKTKVTCYRADHTPHFVADWDLAGLRESLRKLLPPLTDRDIAAFSDAKNTYFRHQSADYIPGGGFGAVAPRG
jgi:DNA invertase Pin-like site-specific DNA recombinase